METVDALRGAEMMERTLKITDVLAGSHQIKNRLQIVGYNVMPLARDGSGRREVYAFGPAQPLRESIGMRIERAGALVQLLRLPKIEIFAARFSLANALLYQLIERFGRELSQSCGH